MELTEEIRKQAEASLNNPGHFIVEVIASLRGNPRKLVVVVDGDQGVTIDDCANLSRVLSDSLDKSDFMKDAFLLEVTTPGLDQPLKSRRQYVKNIGRKVRVRTREKTIEGKLVAVGDEAIEVMEQIGNGKKRIDNLLTIEFQKIEKTLVLVSFK